MHLNQGFESSKSYDVDNHSWNQIKPILSQIFLLPLIIFKSGLTPLKLLQIKSCASESRI